MRFGIHVIAFAFGISLAVGLANPVKADAIDGDWCFDDGRLMSIARTHVVTPGGNRIRGLYDRHAYAYTVPEGEEGAGATIYMVLANPDTIHLWMDEASAQERKPPAEIWRRCSAHVS